MIRNRITQVIAVNFICLIILLVAFSGHASDRTIKAGLAHNPFFAFKTNGGYSGLSVEVLDHIAALEGWELQYVPCIWAECLELLERGEIDIQVFIAYSDERTKYYDFTEQTLFTTWGQIFVRPDSKIESILDLEGKKISVVKKNIHTRELKKLLFNFQINSDLVEVDDSLSALKLAEVRKVEAALTSRTWGILHAKKFNVQNSPIIFNPIEIRYATPKGKNQDLRVAIDKHLIVLKKNPDSIYNQQLGNLLGDILTKEVPKWVKPVLYSASILILIFVVAALFQRKRVQEKAKEIEERKQIESELRQVNEKLQNALDEIRVLRGILSVCTYCKNIKNDKGGWSQIEAYISERSEAKFSHGICPGCMKKNHPEEYESLVLKGKIKE